MIPHPIRPFDLESADTRVAARAAALFAAAVGLLCLVGWATHRALPAALLPGALQMKVNAAVCTVACGAALLLLAERGRPRLQRPGRLLSLVPLLLGLATLAEYGFGWRLGIDEAFALDPTGPYDTFPGRMSPYSGSAFVSLGAALIVLPHPRYHALSMWGAICALAVGTISLTGYLWNLGALISDRWLPPVPVTSALCFIALGGGLLLCVEAPGARTLADPGALAPLEIKILAGFVASMSLLLLGGSYTYRSDERFADAALHMTHAQHVRAALASVYGTLAGAEVALRDYVLTEDAGERAEYQRLVGDVGRQLESLERLTRGDPLQLTGIRQLRPMVASRLAAMREELDAYTRAGLPAMRGVITRNRGQNATRAVHELTERMAAIEEQALNERGRSIAAARDVTLISLLGTLAVAVGFFTALFRAIHREMLARRTAEAALRTSEEYNRRIVDSSPDCLALLALDGRVRQMNPQGRRLMQVGTSADILGADWLAMWGQPDRAAARGAFDAACNGRDGRFQGFCATFKGAPKWWDVITMPVLGIDGRPDHVLAVARDISDVKRSESELLEANRFLDSLIENLPASVVVKDAATLVPVRINRAFERLLGYRREEFLGRQAAELFSPEESAFIVAKDREALAVGRLVDIPEQTIQTDHLGTRVFHTMKLPLIGRDGTPQHLLAISVDITERKLAGDAIRELNAALEAKAEQLIATNRELESFSYSVSHDLRAPLRAVDGFAQMLEEDYGGRLDAEGQRYLRVIRGNGRRMGSLIDDLLAFSRLGRHTVRTLEVDVEALVREVAAETAAPAPGHRPSIVIGPLPPARGDRALLRQVWTNLLSNAVKYSAKSAHPCIEVSGWRDGPESAYSIRDNGVGFNMEYAGRLFGVFQRLHRADEFEGSGVGLAIVQRIVERHGGRVWAEGRVNHGAVFSFALPDAAGDA